MLSRIQESYDGNDVMGIGIHMHDGVNGRNDGSATGNSATQATKCGVKAKQDSRLDVAAKVESHDTSTLPRTR